MMRAASFDIAGTAELVIKIAALVDTVDPAAAGIPCRLDRDQRPFGMRSSHTSRRLSQGSGRAIRHFRKHV
jgi:hypothetical protein